MLYAELSIVVVLVFINGLFAMSELAVVSSRPARLKAMAERGSKGAAKALELTEDPGRFLSAVQIGITLVGVLSGAFSGATLGERLGNFLISLGVSAVTAHALGVAVVVALITYLSLIVGELVPKQIALRDPEAIAARVAPGMSLLAKVGAPLVWLLDISGRGLLWLLGQSSQSEARVTDEEIRTLIAEAETHGTIESDERRMIAGVMRLGDRTARAVMTPRADVDWLDLTGDLADTRELLSHTRHSRLPAGEGSADEIVGVAQTRELLTALLEAKRPFNPREHVKPAPVVHEHADALDVLKLLREADVPMALVHDEYGHLEGIITPADILEAITGVFKVDIEESDTLAVQREDGSWLLPGSLPADEVDDLLRLRLPEKRDYATLAGLILSHLNHLPATGEKTELMGWEFEVVDLDGRRIDKVIARRPAPPE